MYFRNVSLKGDVMEEMQKHLGAIAVALINQGLCGDDLEREFRRMAKAIAEEFSAMWFKWQDDQKSP